MKLKQLLQGYRARKLAYLHCDIFDMQDFLESCKFSLTQHNESSVCRPMLAVDSHAFNEMMESVSEEWLTLTIALTNPEVFLKAFVKSATSKKISLRSEVKSVIS